MPRKLARPSSAPGAELFDPVETEILRRYFGLPTEMAREALFAEPRAEDEEWPETFAGADIAFGVRLESVNVTAPSGEDAAVARAVARLCLHVVDRRPEARRGGTPAGTLARFAAERHHEVAPFAAPLLFTIDWAMLGWPESYFAVLVPGFDRYVVVKASDEECIGGRWLALGWFERGRDAVKEVERIISGWWGFEAGEQQERWESFIRAGTISRGMASAWADEVWPDAEEAEDEWSEESEEDEEEESDELEASDDEDEETTDDAVTP